VARPMHARMAQDALSKPACPHPCDCTVTFTRGSRKGCMRHAHTIVHPHKCVSNPLWTIHTVSISPASLLKNNASLHTSSVHQERAKGQSLKAA
jgi:hypothetical protein